MPSLRRKQDWAVTLAAFVLFAVVAFRGGLIRAADNVLILVQASVSSTGEQANLNSDEPVLSNLGRYVAFHSFATNLVPNDGNLFRDVFVHDRVTGVTKKVSISSRGEPGLGGSAEPSISHDGRYVAFESWAPNLVPGDSNWTWDVFVHDRHTGRTERVSVSNEGKQGYRPSQSASISGDGRYVAFESDADNLVPHDRNGDEDVFVYDRETKTIRLVSVASDGTQGNDDSSDPSISADGRYVVFESEASNLVPGDTNRRQDIFLHDLETGETRRVSISSTGEQPNRDSEVPAISGNGRFVVFESRASNLVPDDTNRARDVFVHEWATGKTTRVTVSSDGEEGDRGGEDAAISADGRFVVFESKSRNLVPDDTNRQTDVFVHDRQTGETRRVSLTREGAQVRRESDEPDISPDGAFVAFEADSPLLPEDTSRREDIYVRETGLVVNAPPVAEDDETITPQDTPVDVDVLANDSDPNGDPFFISGFTQPANGTVRLNEDLTFRYVPNTGFNGPDEFTYTLDDTRGGTDTATVRILVEPATPPGPQSVDDEATTVAGTPVDVPVLANDSGDGLSVTEVSDPPHGIAIINADNTVTYTPDPGFVGADAFDYTASDTNGLTDTATVHVTVDPPPVVLMDDEAETFVGVAVTIAVLANDSGDGLTVTAVTDPANGTTAINPDGTIIYTPDPAFEGLDAFDYTATDAHGVSGTAMVSVTVTPSPNNPPIALNDQASTFEGVPVAIDVLANDTDADGEPLMLVSVTPPSGGTAVLSGDDSVLYTPNPSFAGLDQFTYTMTDPRAATASASVRVNVLADEIPPTITGRLAPPANALGWNRTDVTVTFDCQDAESGLESCSDPVTVTSEGADQRITGTAVDRAGNTARTTVIVNVDKTAPTIFLSGPSTARPGQSVTVDADVSDGFPLDFVRFVVDGVEVPDKKSPPFQHTFSVPASAPTGATITVEAVVADRAGNTVSAAPFPIAIQGGGFVQGEVYDDRRGVPLPGTTVTLDGQAVLSDALGRFGTFSDAGSGVLRFEREGFTSVERVVVLDSLAGTLVLDARLTPIDSPATTIDETGGTASAGRFELTVPPVALSSSIEIRLIELSPLALTAPLPLGWSPVGGVQIEPAETLFAVPAELRLTADGTSGRSAVLARYDEAQHLWIAEEIDLTGETFVSAPVGATGSYAFVVADTGATAPPAPVAGDPLPASAPVEVAFGLSATSEVTPEISPVSPDAMATGSVALSSLIELPSGSLVSARVEESFDSFVEGELRTEPFAQEIPVYRFPPRDDGALHASFPVTPTRRFEVDEILEGKIHVEIRPSPSFVRGSLVGGEGQVVGGPNGAELVIPAGALGDTVAAFVEAFDPASLNLGFEGLSLLGAAEVDLAGATLAIPGTLSIPADLAGGDDLFAARFLFVAGQRKLSLLGPAAFDAGRVSVEGVDSGGIHLFFQSDEPLALVQGVVTEGGTPARLVVVESSSTPFMDVTADDGVYRVATALKETTITARSLVSGNIGSTVVTPATPDPVNADIVLATTGPFVATVTPSNGQQGVALAPVIQVTFSEPVEPSTVDATSFILTMASDGTPVSGRIVLGNADRSASFLPSNNLEPLTAYAISLTAAITDTAGNGLLPFNSSFTTLEDAPAGFDPDAVTVSFPDDAGDVFVEAPPGSFEPGASVLILNNTNGIVLSGVVQPDGGFSFQIRAAITDELQIRIVDSADREVVIEKTEYHAADGSVAIGTKGGKVTVGEFVLEVPEGALDGAAIFQLRPLTQEEIDALPLPEGAGGLGSGVEVDIGETRLQEEADLSFPVPLDAPPDADFLIVRKVEVEDLILYQTIDSASVQDGKVVTDSFPFLGVLVTGVYQPIWFPPLAATGKSPLGVITGIARESDGNPVKPTIVPLPDVVVSADKNLGLGDYTATTAADGRFTLWDVNFGSTGGTVNLVATDSKNREVRAIAFESPGLFSEFPALARYNKAGEVVFNFDLSPPPPPPPAVTIRLFRENTDGDEVEIKNGFAATGEELLIRFHFTDPPSQTNASINGIPVVMEKVDGFNFLARFTPPDARSYTLTGSAIDAFFRQVTFSKSFLGVAAGGGNDEPLPGPPSVISDASMPRPDQAGVGVSDVFQIVFSEPVTNVVPTAVRLQTLGGALVPIEMIGAGPGGVAPVEPDDVITALTIRTQKGLEFSNQYQFVLTGAIVDLDETLPGAPAPNPLNPDPTVINFSTFAPEILGQVDVEEGIGAVILGERAYVLLNTFPGSVRAFDVSDPSNPVRFGAEDNFVFGIARQILAEENVDLGQGVTDLVATFSINTFSGQAILTVLDVDGGGVPPFPWAAVVTLSGTGEATLGVDVHRNFAYAAASDRGVRIFDLSRAAELYRATKKPAEKDPGFEIQKLLFSKGQGFAQEALVQTIPLTAPGGTLRAATVKAGESVLGRVAYVGSFLPADAVGYFSSVNVSGGVSIPVLATLRLEKDGLTMGTPFRIGLTRVGDQDLAVAVGGNAFAVIDVTDPANPVIVSINDLQGSSGRSVSFNSAGTTVFLGTSEGLEAYNLSDPVVPEFAGVLSDLAVGFGDSGVAEDLAFSVDSEEGLKLAALGVIPLVVTDPPVLVTDDAQRVVQPGRFVLQVVPPTFEVATAEVELLAADVVTETIPGVFGTGGFGEAPFDKGLNVPLTNPQMQLIVNRGTQDDRRSGRVSVPTVPLLTVEPTVTLRLEVDPINETTCLLSVDPIVYYLALPAKVTISLIIAGEETVIFSANQTPAGAIPEQFVHPISQFGLFPPSSETHQFRVVAELLEDPTVVAERVGEVHVDARAHNVLPVGHTFVKGVDLLDGHLVTSSTDVSIPGRGPALEVVRTYSSAGSSDEGPFGAGWSLNYFSTLIVTDCFWTIVGGDGSGQRFVREGNTFIPQKGYHTQLRENPDGSFDFFTKGRVQFHYLDVPLFEGDRLYGGRPTLDYIEDPNGNRIQIFYDVNRNVIEAREIFAGGTEGRSLHFEYVDVLGFPRVERITGPLGMEIVYQYDAFANMERVTRDERVEIYEYSLDQDDRHNLVAMTDPNGNRTEYVYFEEGELFPGEQGGEAGQGRFEWVKEVREPEDTTTSFVYDLTDLIATGFFKTFVTDARGNTTEYQLNRNGSPELIIEPGPEGPIVTEMEWAVDDITKIEEIDANGRRTRFVYDDNANLEQEIIETDDFGEVITKFTYDPVFNKMTSKTDAEQRVTLFEIDSTNGNLLSVTDAENHVTEYVYDGLGDLRQQIDPRDGVTVLTYDAFGNQETVTDPLGNVARTVYDARSRLRSSTDDFGRSATMDYDELDRVTVVERTDAKGSSDTETIVRTYYPGGQMQTETNGLDHTTTFFLDSLNRVERTEDTLGLVTETKYDGNGNVTETIDRRGVTTVHTYDSLNRLERVTVSGPFGPEQVVSTFGYDDVGNKLFETDVHSHLTEFEYDDLYRVETRILPTLHEERFTYDLVGNKKTETDANGELTQYEYDDLNRIILMTDPVGNQVQFDYDASGNQILEEDLTRGLKTVTDYDLLNRPLSRVVSSEPDAFSYETSFEYQDTSHTVIETDPRDFKTTTEMDGFDRVHRITQETGTEDLVTTSFYDGNGNLRQTEDAEGRITSFVYDGLNRLERIEHPLGFVSTMDYDGEGNQIEETDRRNVTTTFGYDNLGRLTRTEVVASITGVPSITTIAYDDVAVTRTETDARKFVTVFEMDGQERVLKITDPDGEEQTFTYDGVNKRTEKDKRGFQTQFEYDGLNRLVKVIDPLLQEMTTQYVDSERRVIETDKRNLVKTTQLDALGRLISVTRSGITLEQHEYDGNNNRTLSTDANGNKTQFDYDGANRLTARTDGLDSEDQTKTTFTYDKVGNLLTEKDGRVTGKPFDVRNTYDDLNRLRFVEDGEGNVTELEYDGEGNRTAQIEPEDQRTELDYGELNELVEVRMADTGVFHYDYDENRNRIRQTDAEDNVVEFTYDKLNRLDLMVQDPEGFDLITDHDYDPNGNETKLTDPKGQVVDFEYDELNRLKKKIYHLTAEDFALFTRTHEITYHYDPNDNLEQIDELKSSGTDPPALVSSFKTYDALDRLETETDAFGKTLVFGYDDQGNRTSLTDPDNNVTIYTFDALNRLETVTIAGGITTYRYFPDGLKQSTTNPNGTISTFDYDAADRMTFIQHQGPAGTISAYEYTYDSNGNRLSQVETNAGRTEETTYTYDPVNRLETVTYPEKTVEYEYDLAGNRTRELTTGAGALDKTLHYDAINRLESITDTATGAELTGYTYDANGNTTSKTTDGITTNFLFDIRDQLGEVQQGASILGRYGYDYDGRRIFKIGADGRRHYTYDQESVLTESNDAGLTIAKYEYGLDQLVSLNHQTEGRSFYHLSALDSVSNLTDELGDSRISYFYDAWGLERERIGTSTNRFTFNSLEFDSETELFYALNRFYDPEQGRFLSQDPLLGNVTNAPSLNRYAYSFSNPLRFVDPFGLAAGDWYDPRSYDWGVFAKEFSTGLAETGLNILTVGGYGGVKRGFEEGTIRADDQFSALRAYSEGVFNTLTLGGGEAAIGAVAEGEGALGALGAGGGAAARTILPIDEIGTILDPEASGWDKAQAVATGVVKVAGIASVATAGRGALVRKPGAGTRVSAASGRSGALAEAEAAPSFAKAAKQSSARTIQEAAQNTSAGAQAIARSQSAGTQAARTSSPGLPVKSAVKAGLVNKRGGSGTSVKRAWETVSQSVNRHYQWSRVRARINRGPAQARPNPAFPRGIERQELSHWIIPRRANVPNWLKNARWNLNKLWGSEHALADPMRHQFLSRAWKQANPLPDPLTRFWKRTPTWARAAGAGVGAYGLYELFFDGEE